MKIAGKLSVLISLVTTLAVSGLAGAHHSASMFDPKQTITMQATVKELQWTQPHSWLQVIAKDDKGATKEWALEIGIMAKKEEGWHRKALKPGDKVTVVIHPLRDGGLGGQLVGITMPDGKVFNGGAGGPAP